MKVVTAAEMREIDRLATERHGVSSLTLMENAGAAVADFIGTEFAFAERIAVVCGKGNNGGDGLVVARRLLQAGHAVAVFLLAKPAEMSGDAATMLASFPEKPVIVAGEQELSAEQFSSYELIVDALLGTGFRPPLSPLYAAAIRAMNAAGVPVLSVDMPSGAEADGKRLSKELCADASAIVAFTALKPAHLFAFGNVRTVVREIGVPPELVTSGLRLNLISPDDFCKIFQPRDAESHKGDFGHVLVIGGSVGKAGAAAMAGMSALRSGAGLVTVATAESALPVVASFAPELMTEPLAETMEGTISVLAFEGMRNRGLEIDKYTLAVGPGLSRHPETAQFVRSLIDRAKRRPIVLDADGLNAFQGAAASLHSTERPLVMTPHTGELARLTGMTAVKIEEDRIGVARRFAKEWHAIVVLKGHRTLVAEPGGEVWVNTTGNPGMATGGVGDVLTGIVAGLIAQHPNDVLKATIAAVHVHGVAGDIARDQMGEFSLVATDLLLALPEAIHRVCGDGVAE